MSNFQEAIKNCAFYVNENPFTAAKAFGKALSAKSGIEVPSIRKVVASVISKKPNTARKYRSINYNLIRL